MDYVLLFGIIGFSCLILSFIGYSVTTNKIIKDQEREIAALTTENKRLKSALSGKRHVDNIIYRDYPISNLYPVRQDLFKDF